jgi:hypothetical protein
MEAFLFESSVVSPSLSLTLLPACMHQHVRALLFVKHVPPIAIDTRLPECSPCASAWVCRTAEATEGRA